jgi:agmatine/peptidylarginine deiminase
MAIQYHLKDSDTGNFFVRLRTNPDNTLSATEIRKPGLPAEWFPQSAVQLTWPHKDTDWAPILKEVTTCYIRMALEIALREQLLIVTPEPQNVKALLEQHLPQQALKNISFHHIETNDTWARDHGFLTTLSEKGAMLLDFKFNGWGEKFEATLDNQICRRMMEMGILKGTYCNHLDFVLEGGSIESDGMGTILTTRHCLMAPHRNQPLTQEDIEKRLLEAFGAQQVLWLEHGYLAGDDTDSHIDTLARLCPNNTIAYVQCTDQNDEHYAELKAMEEQLSTFRTLEDEPCRLIPLPMAEPAYDDEGDRLPATYANFLVVNGAVLMPTYGSGELDELAKKQLQKAFPKHEIIGIDCQALILQHGSLHCCTMQFPVGVVG